MAKIDNSCSETKSNGIFSFFFTLYSQSQWTTVHGPKSNLPPVFANKDLLEHRHPHLFMYCLWLFSCYNGLIWVIAMETIWLLKPKSFPICFQKHRHQPLYYSNSQKTWNFAIVCIVILMLLLDFNFLVFGTLYLFGNYIEQGNYFSAMCDGGIGCCDYSFWILCLLWFEAGAHLFLFCFVCLYCVL